MGLIPPDDPKKKWLPNGGYFRFQGLPTSILRLYFGLCDKLSISRQKTSAWPVAI